VFKSYDRTEQPEVILFTYIQQPSGI